MADGELSTRITIFPSRIWAAAASGRSVNLNLGKGLIPIQMLGDYYNDVESTKLGFVKPIFKGGYTYSNLNKLYPEYINTSLKEAIVNFGKKIDGFDNSDSIIAGIESRTSSPVKIIRDENYESNIEGIYPCGEGAGMQVVLLLLK